MATAEHTPRGRGYDSSLIYFHHFNDYWNMTCQKGSSSQANPATCPDYDNYRPVDLWHGSDPSSEGPGRGLNNSAECYVSTPQYCVADEDENLVRCPPYPGAPGDETAGCKYEDELFKDEVLHAIAGSHERQLQSLTPAPFFIMWAAHIVHAPLQVPQRFIAMYSNVADWRRQRYLGMVRFMDSLVEEVVGDLHAKNLWESTLMVLTR
jgi:arylsulfatase I/J